MCHPRSASGIRVTPGLGRDGMSSRPAQMGITSPWGGAGHPCCDLAANKRKKATTNPQKLSCAWSGASNLCSVLGRLCLDPVPCFDPLVKVGQRKTGVRGGVQWAGGSWAGSTGRGAPTAAAAGQERWGEGAEPNVPAAADAGRGAGRAGLSLRPDAAMAVLGCCHGSVGVTSATLTGCCVCAVRAAPEKRVSRAVSRLGRCCRQYGLGGAARVGKKLSLQCRLASSWIHTTRGRPQCCALGTAAQKTLVPAEEWLRRKRR